MAKPDLDLVMRYAHEVIGFYRDGWLKGWYNRFAKINGFRHQRTHRRINDWRRLLCSWIDHEFKFEDYGNPDFRESGGAPGGRPLPARTWNDCRACTHYTFGLPKGHGCACGRTPETCGGAS